MDSSTLTLILLFSFVTISLLVALFLVLQNTKKKQLLLEQKTRELTHLEQQFSMLLERHQQLKEFRNTMDIAELTTRLQTSRLSTTSAPTSYHLNEKYRFILALSEKGMKNPEIASSLSVSLQEVEQVLTLSTLIRS